MQDLQALVEKTVVQLGFELVDFEMSNRGKLLRVFIDKLNPKNTKDSVTIDDCVLVSNQLGNVLTVEHEIDYDRLEVSSAGMDQAFVCNRCPHRYSPFFPHSENNQNILQDSTFLASYLPLAP